MHRWFSVLVVAIILSLPVYSDGDFYSIPSTATPTYDDGGSYASPPAEACRVGECWL